MSMPSEALSNELWREEILRARRIPGAVRFAQAGELFDEMCERMLAGIRARFPGRSDAEHRRMLFEQFEIARRLDALP